MADDKPGRKQHEPTDKTRGEVSALVSYGIPQSDIASYVGIDPKTLRKHYAEELATGQVKRNALVGNFLFNAASGRALKDGANYSECIRAAMFWAKTRMQWREKETGISEEEVGQIIEVVRATKDK